MQKKKSRYNRLYDTRYRTEIKAVRGDALFDKAIDKLMSFGYSSISEVLYDSVYRQLNELTGADIYHTLEVAKQKEDAADRELERALFALKTLNKGLPLRV